MQLHSKFQSLQKAYQYNNICELVAKMAVNGIYLSNQYISISIYIAHPWMQLQLGSTEQFNFMSTVWPPLILIPELIYKYIWFCDQINFSGLSLPQTILCSLAQMLFYPLLPALLPQAAGASKLVRAIPQAPSLMFIQRSATTMCLAPPASQSWRMSRFLVARKS